jgi:cytochrome oxidase assembly protein ShyY1
VVCGGVECSVRDEADKGATNLNVSDKQNIWMWPDCLLNAMARLRGMGGIILAAREYFRKVDQMMNMNPMKISLVVAGSRSSQQRQEDQ